ncbi:MAG: hypothetical protein A3H35_00160 [Betaproteobacteria bacterium RIFCSPLOWO2_02_FULL_62_17]|nr:MAG: hypothetical protein A3H35_00160 [Betaproteobacteria bacterium RIFCSPLOWO2_02_FULL_62_17]
MSEEDTVRNETPTGSDAAVISRPDRWGLLPDQSDGGKHDLKTLFVYWFVQFNPLYFISAFCVLYGVFLVARNIDAFDPGSPERAQFVLFAVIQAYEALIVGGAVFLVNRANAVRPAVLLTLLEAVFLFDCTFRLESIVLVGAIPASFAMGAWLLLAAVKLRVLAAVMRVQLTRWHYTTVIGTALGIVGVIALLSQPGTDKLMMLQLAAWFGTLVMLLLDVRRPRLASMLAQTDDERLRADRCIMAIFRLLAGFYFYHVWSYILLAAGPDIMGAAILPQAGAFFVLHAIVRERAKDTWIFAVLTLIATLPAAVAMPYAMFLLAAVFAYRVWCGARGGLAVGAAFALYAGLWLYGWQGGNQPLPDLPSLWSWRTAALLIILCLIGWLLRDPLAWAILGAGALYAGYRGFEQFFPKSELGLGLLLLAAGFIVFALGLAINWWFRAAPKEPEPPPSPEPPSSPEQNTGT